jgi:hypothetical protein
VNEKRSVSLLSMKQNEIMNRIVKKKKNEQGPYTTKYKIQTEHYNTNKAQQKQY